MPKYHNISYSNLAALVEHVANAWQANHANYSTNFITPAQLSILASQFKNTRMDSVSKTAEKRLNTDTLSNINKSINTATTMLKRLIKALYPLQKNYDHIYSMYGLKSEPTKAKKNAAKQNGNNAQSGDSFVQQTEIAAKPKQKQKPTYKLPIDNDERVAAISILINKMQEPNDLIATQTYGLQTWLNLQTDHQTAWSASRTLKSARTVPVRATEEQSNALKVILSRLRMQICIDFHGTNIGQVYREFGFLDEI